MMSCVWREVPLLLVFQNEGAKKGKAGGMVAKREEGQCHKVLGIL
jgi:hypothetical protein